MFEGRKVSGRIASIDRHYVPSYRKRQGNKVCRVLCEGQQYTTSNISLSRLSMKVYSKGLHTLQQKLINVMVTCAAGDSIYANNANRKFCTKCGISTSFVRKGRVAKDEPLRKVLRSELSKERATRLEGSFGTQKRMTYVCRNNQKEPLDFFREVMSSQIRLSEKAQEDTIKLAYEVIILCHLRMQ